MEGQREARPLNPDGRSSALPPWTGTEPEALSDLDRRVVHEARTEIFAEPLVESRGPVGCIGALLGAALLVFWPALVEVVPGGGFVSPFVLLGGLILVVGGILSTFMVGRKNRAAHAAAEAALRQLEGGGHTADGGQREIALRAATLLISRAFVSDGPTTVETFDRYEAANRIESAMPLVLGVQAVLIDELGAWVPFTIAPTDR